jgi:cold shock CspA family protein
MLILFKNSGYLGSTRVARFVLNRGRQQRAASQELGWCALKKRLQLVLSCPAKVRPAKRGNLRVFRVSQAFGLIERQGGHGTSFQISDGSNAEVIEAGVAVNFNVEQTEKGPRYAEVFFMESTRMASNVATAANH